MGKTRHKSSPYRVSDGRENDRDGAHVWSGSSAPFPTSRRFRFTPRTDVLPAVLLDQLARRSGVVGDLGHRDLAPQGRSYSELLDRLFEGLLFVGGHDRPEMLEALTNDVDGPAGHAQSKRSFVGSTGCSFQSSRTSTRLPPPPRLLHFIRRPKEHVILRNYGFELHLP